MGLLADVARLKKLVRKTLILEIIRKFPDLTEQDLRSVLEGWRFTHGRTQEEINYLIGYTLEHGCWPDDIEAAKPFSNNKDARSRLREDAAPVITESKALRMIADWAPTIPIDTLEAEIQLHLEANRRTDAENDFLLQHGYWPENEPGKVDSDVSG